MFYNIDNYIIFIVILFVLFVVGYLHVFIVKRIKHLSKAFIHGYKSALPLTENETLVKNIEQLKESTFESQEKVKFGKKKKGSSYQAIRKEWKSIIQNQEYDCAFEDEFYSVLVKWLERIDWSNLDDVKVLYKYIALIAYDDNYEISASLSSDYNKRILAIIKKLMLKEDFTIEDKLYAEKLGRLIENLIHIYFYHSPLDTKKDIAQVMPHFIKAFPDNCSLLSMRILEENADDLVEVCADLLQHYVINEIDYSYSFTSKLFGKDQRPSDPIYANAKSILKSMLDISTLSETQVDYLTEEVLFTHLNITNLERQVEKKIKHINDLKAYAKDKVVVKEENKLVDFIANFDRKFAKRWKKAISRLAVSRSMFKSVELLIETFPEHEKTKVLINLLDETKMYKDIPKRYDFNQNPQVVFKDLHFKYLVIEELMYNQNVLFPSFDVGYFASEYDKREIDVEYEGYEVIPEVKEYFKNLDIPIELLAKVTTLYQDSGMSGGSEFIYQLQPFWDPGAGDEVFKISDKAIDDLELLPNLKKIIGLENSEPSQKLIKAIQNKGVVLEHEDD